MSNRKDPDDRRRWRFLTADDQWYWTRCAEDGTELTKGGPFPTLKACLEDARSSGYVAHVPERRASHYAAANDKLKKNA